MPLLLLIDDDDDGSGGCCCCCLVCACVLGVRLESRIFFSGGGMLKVDFDCVVVGGGGGM